MSFLAPFYLVAGLAIALPIAFHMIRRTPQGKQVFGSTMFLTPSPPRMTRRSRIEDWVLLCLRGLAICLLALAFARPFLTSKTMGAATEKSSQRLLVLLDRSASMQRDGYWERALARLDELLQTARPGDAVEIQTFDTKSFPRVRFAEWSRWAPTIRVKNAMTIVSQEQPGWNGTTAGEVLRQAAEQIVVDQEDPSKELLVVLISDMQLGAGWNAVQGVNWPAGVKVRVVNIAEPGESNAAVQVTQNPLHRDSLRARISSASNSSKDTFQLTWADEFSPTSSTNASSERLTVPPGRSRVVPLPPRPAEASAHALILSGDDVEFDNTFYVSPPLTQSIQILSLGRGSGDELRMFLNPLFPDDPTRDVTILDWDRPDLPASLIEKELGWVIVTTAPDPEQMRWLKSWIERGGEVLFVARDASQSQSLYELLSTTPATVEEAQVTNYAMLGQVDLSHPALKQFDDPRFSDFTKLRFWKYRRFESASIPGMRILAAMENGDPALTEIPTGKGRIILLTSSWSRDDSDLTVWSKFVPLMNGLLDYVSREEISYPQLTVGDSIPLSRLGLDGETITVGHHSQQRQFPRSESLQFDRPGLYRFAAGPDDDSSADAVTLAVNLPAEESRTEPYSLDQLEAAGVPLDDPESALARDERKQRQERLLLNQELESRQQWWRWLVTAGVFVLLAETALSTWKGRRQTATA
ncbi:BatA domain-containing protein [Planctomicrobium sp. SH661]|uniref:BatA domain-containing protein n=1 Tax=Planctomicrobium sp. SH661 TaxID=3448124 RepID=UPI003F5BCBC4